MGGYFYSLPYFYCSSYLLLNQNVEEVEILKGPCLRILGKKMPLLNLIRLHFTTLALLRFSFLLFSLQHLFYYNKIIQYHHSSLNSIHKPLILLLIYFILFFTPTLSKSVTFLLNAGFPSFTSGYVVVSSFLVLYLVTHGKSYPCQQWESVLNRRRLLHHHRALLTLAE